MHKQSRSQKGFSLVAVIATVVALGTLGTASFFVYRAKHKVTVATKTTTTATANTPATAQTPATVDTKTSTKQPEVTKKFLNITEWGVKFSLDDAALAGATYISPAPYESDPEYKGLVDYIAVVTPTVKALRCDYDGGSTTGFPIKLFRTTSKAAVDNLTVAGSEVVTKKIEAYYYVHDIHIGNGSCEFTTADRATLTSFEKAFYTATENISAL